MTRIWEWLKNNLGAILNIAIVAAGIVIVWQDMAGKAGPEAIQEATLALLSLIGASLLMNQASNSRWQRTMGEILGRSHKPSASQVLAPLKEYVREIDQRLWFAKEVWVLSRSCIRIWEDYHDQFTELLGDDKGIVRLMLVDPNNGAVKMLVKNSMGFEHFDAFNLLQTDINGFLARQAWLCSQPEGKNLQVRTIDYLPAWTLIIIDPGSDRGVIYVELGTYCAKSRGRPTFSLMADGDTQLFQLVREEFETMWKHARTLDPAAYGGRTTSGQSPEHNEAKDKP
jgi:hypothetical protein